MLLDPSLNRDRKIGPPKAKCVGLGTTVSTLVPAAESQGETRARSAG
jgi:hypothetical protein